MKIGIVGAGFMGSMHARMLATMDNIELAGIAGKTEDNAKVVAKETGIQCITNWEELLNDDSIHLIDI